MGYIYLIKICSLKDAYVNRVFSFRNMYNNKILESIDIDSNKNMCGIIKDDICIYKFGKTINLSNRFKEHCKSYGSLTQCINLHLIYSKEVSDSMLSIEEYKVKNMLMDKNLYFIEKSYDKKVSYKELILIRDCDVNNVVESIKNL